MDPRTSSDHGGIRRRHSTHGDTEAGIEPSQLNATTLAGSDDVRPSTTESTQRVRFSADVPRKSKKRKSDELLGDKDGLNSRNGMPSLKIDTSAGSAQQGAYSSPNNMFSSTSAKRQYPVLSPKPRTRGMSLRSSMFMKQMSNRSTLDNSVIELQSMSGPAGDDAASQAPGHSKKASRSTVREIFPIGRSPSPSSLESKTAPGTSALPNYQQWVQRRARRHLPLRTIRNVYNKTRNYILRAQEVPPSKSGRQIPYDAYRKEALIDERTNRPFVSNLIRSSKYTPWNFLPRQLFAQFSKIANAYFLTISILQMIPGLSTTGNYTTIIPLLFFVAISMGKEGYEDLRRHRLDKVENNRQTQVLHAYNPVMTTDDEQRALSLNGPIHWSRVKWHALQVGDIVKLRRDEMVPADMVILGSSHENDVAYIETMALDGETNLKNKQPASATAAAASSMESLAAVKMHLTVEDPNLDLYNFQGRVSIGDSIAPLTNNEVIYRGSVIRNTPEVIGIVIYSGEECKIRMNANKNPRIKAPTLQSKVNNVVLIVVCIVIFLAVFNALAYQVWQGSTEKNAWYLTHAHVPFVQIFMGFIIMFNTMIPLSLYVSMEIIKVAQMVLLNDIDMYDEDSNTPFEARTSTINEELGQVGYIFSDKTGTLTENIMRFRKLSVAGAAWLHDVDRKEEHSGEAMLLHKKRGRTGKGKEPARRMRNSSSHGALRVSSSGRNAVVTDLSNRERSPLSVRRKSTSQWKSSAMPEMAQTELSCVDLIRYIQQRPETHFAQKAKLMVISMAVCHTCLPERRGEDHDNITFQASSPDELALVQAAKELGFLAFARDSSTLTLKIHPPGSSQEPLFETYEIMDVIEFSSKRKRMSVVVRFPDDRIAVICKGADSMIMDRLRLSNLANHMLAKIEKRVMDRKSMEAEQVLLRKSSQIERKASVGNLARTSLSLGRNSITIGRPSIGRLAPVRDEVDSWLNERESDIAINSAVALNLRPSMALSERRRSLESDFDDVSHIEESMVADDAGVIERCLQHVTDFATEGLRTLLYGYRFLDEQEYRSWKKVYHDATTSLVDRQALVERAGELIEQQLELGGATAIEDKLQKGVPETIDRLRRAKISLWMLTGDKRETAINIGHSCGLIKDYSSLTLLDHEAGRVEQNIAASVIDINSGGIAHSVVVVDGQTLGAIEADKALHKLFLDLAILADSVICCRASPSQKAGLVSAIRRRVRGSVTLAIGDGANDIAMIQEAHVGIGITGREGLQAARTSDYSIAQFRFLTKLLLVHGRWNYIRTCKYTLATFWKEACFFLTQALFQHFNGYTGTSLYEQWSLSMFNTLFTSLVVIFLGIFEQDLRASTLIAVPELYTKGQRSAGFNLRVFFAWLFMAIAEACIIFFIMWGLYGHASFLADPGIFPMGDMTFTACVILIAAKTQLIEQRYKSIMAVVGLILSVGGWLLWNMILAAIYHNNHEYNVKGGFFYRFGKSGLWWATLLFAVSACCLLEIALRALKAAFFPTDVETFQTLEQDLDVRKRFEEASAPWMQAGWNHGSKRSSLEIRREAAEQAQREEEIQKLLARPRDLEAGKAKDNVETEEQPVFIDDGAGRGSIDIQEVLSRRYGSVRRESLAKP